MVGQLAQRRLDALEVAVIMKRQRLVEHPIRMKAVAGMHPHRRRAAQLLQRLSDLGLALRL